MPQHQRKRMAFLPSMQLQTNSRLLHCQSSHKFSCALHSLNIHLRCATYNTLSLFNTKKATVTNVVRKERCWMCFQKSFRPSGDAQSNLLRKCIIKCYIQTSFYFILNPFYCYVLYFYLEKMWELQFTPITDTTPDTDRTQAGPDLHTKGKTWTVIN